MSPLDATCALLAERYGDVGEQAAERLKLWIGDALPFTHPEMLERHLSEEHVPLLFDAFWQVLPFGTGGRRGRVGYGANRMNETTVAMTVQGHCDFLRRSATADATLQVVVANDVRVFRDISGTYGFLGNDHPLVGVSARSLSRLACEIYAGNGIVAWVEAPEDDAAFLTTPELSFLIGELGADGGINVSASHNPPDDNGIKTYDAFGSQPVAPEDQALIDVMESARNVKSIPFSKALAEGRVRAIPPATHQAYLDLYVGLYDQIHTPTKHTPIVYTPLCGCGLRTVGDVLSTLGFPVLTPEAEHADGRFAPIPFRAPNPEVPQATEPARAFAETQGASIVLSTDPDADRIGLEILLPGGEWFHFDGNQIAAILGYYLMLDPEGPKRQGLVVETAVTTKILRRVVEQAGKSFIVDDLLVGFKYVADVLKRLERGEVYAGVSCDPKDLVLAAEESHGVIMLPGIRDKDASPAAMYLAALHQRETARGHTLLDYYAHLLEQLGGFDNVNRSIVMLGAEGILQKDRIMQSLREMAPDEIGGQPVRKVVDYWDENAFGAFLSESDKLPRNVIQLQTDAFIVTIRPSGTEPKLKLYCQLLPSADDPKLTGNALLAAVRERAERVARDIYGDLLARINTKLGAPGLLLPDIVDLDRKVEFDTKTVPALQQALTTGAHRDLDSLLEWLGQAVAAMTPGTDALPAVKAPIAALCREWHTTNPDLPLLKPLTAWAQS